MRRSSELKGALAKRVRPRGKVERLKRNPDSYDLLLLWLNTHFHGRPCVVFAEPDGYSDTRSHYDVVRQHLGNWRPFDDVDSRAPWAYSVLPCRTLRAAHTIVDATPDSAPYTYLWDGRRNHPHQLVR